MSASALVNSDAEAFALSLLSYGGADALYAHSWDGLFACKDHVAIFSAIRAAVAEGAPTDAHAIAVRMDSCGQAKAAGGAGQIMSTLMEAGCAQPANLDYYHGLLAQAAAFRRVHALVVEALPALKGGGLDLAEFIEQLSTAADVRETTRHPKLTEQVQELISHLEQKIPPERFGTGIPSLDRALGGGVQRGEMLVVAGPTGGGKSVVLAQAATAACEAQKHVVFYTLEMPASTILSRVASCLGRVHVRPICEEPRPTVDEARKMASALSRVSQFPLTIRSGIHRLDDLVADAQRLIRSGKADVIVVDYLQRIDHAGDTREQAVNECARRLKSLSLEMNVAVFTASQLNDDGKLRDSRAIGMEADVVALISSESDSIHLAKFRRGKPFVTLPVVLRGALSRFEDRIQRREAA